MQLPQCLTVSGAASVGLHPHAELLESYHLQAHFRCREIEDTGEPRLDRDHSVVARPHPGRDHSVAVYPRKSGALHDAVLCPGVEWELYVSAVRQ